LTDHGTGVIETVIDVVPDGRMSAPSCAIIWACGGCSGVPSAMIGLVPEGTATVFVAPVAPPSWPLDGAR
jgi:hypothetical protein